MAARASGPVTVPLASHSVAAAKHPTRPPAPVRGNYGIAPAPAPERVHVNLKLGLKSGLLFDVTTGQVLWERNPSQSVPIASLTKMMTALVVVAHSRPERQGPDHQRRAPLHGLGRRVASEEQARPADSTALRLAASVRQRRGDRARGPRRRDPAAVHRPHEPRAHAMGLTCTHYTTVSGIVDQGNHSCASDLALIAHDGPRPAAAGEDRRLAQRDRAVPDQGREAVPLQQQPPARAPLPRHRRGQDGFTDAAGQCLVATARRGSRWLGVVLLHSGNTYAQACSC